MFSVQEIEGKRICFCRRSCRKVGCVPFAASVETESEHWRRGNKKKKLLVSLSLSLLTCEAVERAREGESSTIRKAHMHTRGAF